MGYRVRAVAVLAAGVAAWAWGPRTVCEGFLPENDLKIPVGDVSAKGIAEASFNSVLDKVEAIYKPVVAARGGKLVVRRKWEDPTVNASAQQSWGTWYINMYGGLARHAAITEEGFALVACHEMGHHLGGFPTMSWATNEGGADYFSTLKCLRQFYPGDQPPATVDPVGAAACDGLYPDGPDRNRCKSGVMAGISVANLFHALRPGPQPPSLSTPDTSVVDQTNNAHPAGQCRLDTYFQGAQCLKPVSEELSNSAPAPGSCTRSQGFRVGLRPSCWYKAPEGQEGPALLADAPRAPDEKALGRLAEAMGEVLSGHGL